MAVSITISNSTTSRTLSNIINISESSILASTESYISFQQLRSFLTPGQDSISSIHTWWSRCPIDISARTTFNNLISMSGPSGEIIISSDEAISTFTTSTNNSYNDIRCIVDYSNPIYQSLTYETTRSILRYQSSIRNSTKASYTGLGFTYLNNSTDTQTTILGTSSSTYLSSYVNTQASSYEYDAGVVNTSISAASTSTVSNASATYSGSRVVYTTRSAIGVTLTNAPGYEWNLYSTTEVASTRTQNRLYIKSINTSFLTITSLFSYLNSYTYRGFTNRNAQVSDTWMSVLTYTGTYFNLQGNYIFLNDSFTSYSNETFPAGEINMLNPITISKLYSANNNSTVASFFKLDNQLWTATTGVSTAVWNRSTTILSSSSSYFDSLATYPNGNVYETYTSSTVSDNEFEYSHSTKESIVTLSYNFNGVSIIDSSLSESSLSIAAEESRNEFYSTSTTTFTYGFGRNYSVETTLSASHSYSNYETHTIPLRSTTTALELDSFTNGEYYEYYTTFYGTISGVGINTTSWVNEAVKTSDSYYTMSENSYIWVTYNLSEFGNMYESTYISSIISSDESIVDYITSSKSYLTELTKTTTEKHNFMLNTYTDVVYTYVVSYITSIINFTSMTNYNTLFYGGIMTATSDFIEIYSYNVNYSTAYNTSEYGSTARISSLVSSDNWVNVFNTYLADNYAYTYNVSSIWTYSGTVSDILREYSTQLATSFKREYITETEWSSYSYTKSSSLGVRTTEDRFINRKNITGYSIIGVDITNTVAIYNYSTMATVNQSSETYLSDSYKDTSVIEYTFITSSADFSTVESVADTATISDVRQQFRNSISTVMNSTSEQQNDVLIFQSTVATLSTYNAIATYSTISTVNKTYEATTYTEEYNPISYTGSATAQSTSLQGFTTLSSISDTVRITQSINYTPVYDDVNGVYVTN